MNMKKRLIFFLAWGLTASMALPTYAEEKGQFAPFTDSVTVVSIWVIAILCVCALLFAAIWVLELRIKHMKLEQIADKTIDAETGMGNLQFFNDRFKNTMGEVSRNFYYLAYIVLDISYLRSYYKESSFEDMLQYTASVLSEQTGEGEFSARISENGFALTFFAKSDEAASQKICEVMDTLNGLGNIKKKTGKLVYHAAVYHLDKADKNGEILLFNLRKNCNKILGTDKQIVYCDTHSMNLVREEKEIADRLLKGLQNDEFKMYLQFIVDNRTKQIVSAEVLSRWDNREKGLLGPGEYIADMEASGLISDHDFRMFELACRQLESWRGTEYGNIMLSCNFTRITLSEEDFIDRIVAISDNYRFDKSMLGIEITEDSIERDMDVARQNVVRCKELGLSVYLDDLGSGYTTLANLCDYPIDVVKLDRSILLKTEVPKGKELFAGIVALSHSLNIKVVCEGVETEEQNALVSASDCDFIQGWYYTEALPSEKCEAFVAQYRNA